MLPITGEVVVDYLTGAMLSQGDVDPGHRSRLLVALQRRIGLQFPQAATSQSAKGTRNGGQRGVQQPGDVTQTQALRRRLMGSTAPAARASSAGWSEHCADPPSQHRPSETRQASGRPDQA
jgi:hypothetical protein